MNHLLLLVSLIGFCLAAAASEHSDPAFKVRVKEKANFWDLPKPCPPTGECPWYRKSYLVPDDQVLVDSHIGDFSHVTYVNSTGKKTVGWIESTALNLLGGPVKDPSQDLVTGQVYYRSRADLNSDTFEDLILSEPESFGNGGGVCLVFLKRKDGLFQKVGEIVCHPLAVSLRVTKDRTGIITSYSHASASEGTLLNYTISGWEFREGKSKTIPSEEFDKELSRDGARKMKFEAGSVIKGKPIWRPE